MNRAALFLRVASSLLLLCVAAGSAVAQTDLEKLFKNAQFASATLSPNGKYLATTANINGRFHLAVVEIETGAAKNLAGYEAVDIYQINWISDERIVFNIIDREEKQNSSYSGLHSIDREGSRLTNLGRPMDGGPATIGWTGKPYHMEIAGIVRSDPDSIIALGHFYNRDVLPYRIESTTGRRKEIAYNVNGLPRGFVFDAKSQLRVVVTANAIESELTIWHADQTGQEWKKLSTHSRLDPKFTALAFDADNTTMLVSAPTAEGRLGIYKYDFVNNKPGELLAADKSVDVGSGLVFGPDTKKLLGVRMQTEPPQTIWLDKSLASLQAGIDKAYPGMVNVIHPGNAGAALLIHSYSSTHPGNYALYYPDKKKLQNLLATRPWIDPTKMSPQLVYDYVARDGLPIVSYLTLPKGREARDLPLVVNVHGGPWVRDRWGFSREVQFLAGLGYAVLQPQFRGSTGFGDAHFKKSFGQWGLAMQDDITDGINSLVKQGVVDPKRICIMGASYGGYAAMMGLVKDPDLYRCGVNLLGVTDIGYLFTEGAWRNDRVAGYAFKEMVGDPDALRAQFVATSPSKQADKIRAPVFMAYGEHDLRVPLIHGEEMRDALKKHKKVYQYMELEKEEHGFAAEKTRYRVYGAIENFLKTYNPAK